MPCTEHIMLNGGGIYINKGKRNGEAQGYKHCYKCKISFALEYFKNNYCNKQNPKPNKKDSRIKPKPRKAMPVDSQRNTLVCRHEDDHYQYNDNHTHC